MSAQNWNAKKLENFLKSFKFISWIQIRISACGSGSKRPFFIWIRIHNTGNGTL